MNKPHYYNLLFSTIVVAVISVSFITTLYFVPDESIHNFTHTDKIDTVINMIKTDELVPTKEQMITLLEIDKKISSSFRDSLFSIKKVIISVGALLGIIVFIQINILIKNRGNSKQA